MGRNEERYRAEITGKHEIRFDRTQVSIIYGRRITRDFVEYYVTTTDDSAETTRSVRRKAYGENELFFLLLFSAVLQKMIFYTARMPVSNATTRCSRKLTVPAAVWSRIFVLRSRIVLIYYIAATIETHIRAGRHVYGPIRFYSPKQYETRVVHTFRPVHNRPGLAPVRSFRKLFFFFLNKFYTR